MNIAITQQNLVTPTPHKLVLWWRQLAYRHKSAEFLLYLMFVSGLLLWDALWAALSLDWQILRWLLPLHMLIGATLFTVVVGAFWSAHRRLLRSSKKVFLRRTGSVIEWLLLICTLSGFYLFFYGNTGNTLGEVMQNVHFYSTWLLVPLIFRHAMRWSILKLTSMRVFIHHCYRRIVV